MQILSNPISALMYANSRNFCFFKEIGVEKHDGTSDFRLEVEIRPFRACAMKNMQPYMGELAKCSSLLRNRGRGTRWLRQI